MKLYVFALALLLQACVQMPQTADEFRKAAPGGIFVETNKFEVKGASLAEVKGRYERFAAKCLHMQVQKSCVTVGIGNGCKTGPTGTVTYTPKVVLKNARVTLTLQELYTNSNLIYTTKVPKDGLFNFLSDVTQGRDGRLSGVAYGTSKGIVTAAANWARGESQLCPEHL